MFLPSTVCLDVVWMQVSRWWGKGTDMTSSIIQLDFSGGERVILIPDRHGVTQRYVLEPCLVYPGQELRLRFCRDVVARPGIACRHTHETILFQGGGHSCTCESYRYRPTLVGCKHILAARTLLGWLPGFQELIGSRATYERVESLEAADEPQVLGYPGEDDL